MATDIIAIIQLAVNDALHNIRIETYNKDMIVANTYFMFWDIKFTVLASKYPEMFPNGFPTSLNGGFPDHAIFTKHILFWDVHLTLTAKDWRNLVTLLKAKGVI